MCCECVANVSGFVGSVSSEQWSPTADARHEKGCRFFLKKNLKKGFRYFLKKI
jgi:hypothetical protein